ncbi:MAG: M28 family peptidase [Bacteroidota bacterium]
MIRILVFLLFALTCNGMYAQMAANDLPENKLQKEVFETHLRYLASDAMEGRYTASEGGEKAALYLARLFSSYGLQPAPDGNGYFQKIPFDKVLPPTSATIKMGGSKYSQGDNMVVFTGKEMSVETEAVFVGHGWIDSLTGHNDYEGIDVTGKIVFTKTGTPGNQDPFAAFKAGARKRSIAKERGAIGVVELFRMKFPWQFFKNYFNKERLDVVDLAEEGANDLFYAFLKEETPNPVKELEAGENLAITLNHSGIEGQRVSASNVVGVLEGSDEELKDEYILISAHYDHVGVGKQGGGAFTPQDSIFNGSRDNAMGTVAMLAAIKSLVQNPPKRSVIFLACTGEEMGMIGSAYYAENPLVPLEKTVFNLNNDGGGYNTTEQFSVIGYSRTNVQPELEQAAMAFGMTISKDPAPEQNLYERSDNISFARKGIPAIDFAPGVTVMDEEIYKYYHQVTDNPETIDYDYLLKFCQAFAHTARLIADKETPIAWTPGDQYEKNR